MTNRRLTDILLLVILNNTKSKIEI